VFVATVFFGHFVIVEFYIHVISSCWLQIFLQTVHSGPKSENIVLFVLHKVFWLFRPRCMLKTLVTGNCACNSHVTHDNVLKSNGQKVKNTIKSTYRIPGKIHVHCEPKKTFYHYLHTKSNRFWQNAV